VYTNYRLALLKVGYLSLVSTCILTEKRRPVYIEYYLPLERSFLNGRNTFIEHKGVASQVFLDACFYLK